VNDMNGMDRRGFLRSSLAASSGAMGFRFEERALFERVRMSEAQTAPAPGSDPLPTGKIKDITVSRIVCGGNLISGFAHSRDLMYVSPLLEHYFTDEKVMETLALCEACGVNTAILRLDEHCLRILNVYWRERGGKIQWIAQVKPKQSDVKTDIVRAVDNGATGVYVQGNVSDTFVANQRVDLIGAAVECIKENGVIAGIGAHEIAVPIACEKAGLEPDFYMKTLNSKRYWSAGPMPRLDSVWEETPEQTIEFMRSVAKPWIAFKVLGAGAIHPREGFQYAFENGADFLCVGMFDFQVDEDVQIAKEILAAKPQRAREWKA
ncbi:MAG: hypothetical protein QG656_2748, partial [Candidatus Hydrogenedentes bacterium]|nr:hypothetical protein [Candidatus Hydrogenedentota bacterium]